MQTLFIQVFFFSLLMTMVVNSAFAASKENELEAVEARGIGSKFDDQHVPLDSGEDSEKSDPLKSKSTAIKSNCKRQKAGGHWVDGLRANTHSRLCNTAKWVDGLFGKNEPFNGKDFIGKVSLGFRHDEVEGFDPKLRVKIKTDLPNMSKRFNAFVGRVEEDSYISNTEVNNNRLNNVGLRSTGDEQNEWLVGLGYRSPNPNSNGLDFSLGAKLSSGLSPYAKAAYRHLIITENNNYFRTTQTVFWRKQDGLGFSSNAEFTNIVNQSNIVVSQASIKYTEEMEQWEWFADTAWHHSLSDKKGISSTMYVRGEAENPVSIPEYGVTFTYIRPIIRDWLTIETGVDFRWEKLTPGRTHKSAVRFGIQFEMQLGNYYARRKRLK